MDLVGPTAAGISSIIDMVDVEPPNAVTRRCWSSIDRELHAKHNRTEQYRARCLTTSQDDHLKGRPHGRPPR